jgi:hypothetical protein
VKGKKRKDTVCGNGILKAKMDKENILFTEKEITRVG